MAAALLPAVKPDPSIHRAAPYLQLPWWGQQNRAKGQEMTSLDKRVKSWPAFNRAKGQQRSFHHSFINLNACYGIGCLLYGCRLALLLPRVNCITLQPTVGRRCLCLLMKFRFFYVRIKANSCWFQKWMLAQTNWWIKLKYPIFWHQRCHQLWLE